MGTKLPQIEDLLLELREVLTEELLAQVLARQAAPDPGSEAAANACPGCQQPPACTDELKHAARSLQPDELSDDQLEAVAGCGWLGSAAGAVADAAG